MKKQKQNKDDSCSSGDGGDGGEALESAGLADGWLKRSLDRATLAVACRPVAEQPKFRKQIVACKEIEQALASNREKR